MNLRKVLPLTISSILVLMAFACEDKEKIRLKKIEKGIELIALDADKLAPEALKMKIQSGVITPEEAKTELVNLYSNASNKMGEGVEKCKKALEEENNAGRSMRMIMYNGVPTAAMGVDRSKIEQIQQAMQKYGDRASHFGQVATSIGAFDTSIK